MAKGIMTVNKPQRTIQKIRRKEDDYASQVINRDARKRVAENQRQTQEMREVQRRNPDKNYAEMVLRNAFKKK